MVPGKEKEPLAGKSLFKTKKKPCKRGVATEIKGKAKIGKTHKKSTRRGPTAAWPEEDVALSDSRMGAKKAGADRSECISQEAGNDIKNSKRRQLERRGHTVVVGEKKSGNRKKWDVRK